MSTYAVCELPFPTERNAIDGTQPIDRKIFVRFRWRTFVVQILFDRKTNYLWCKKLTSQSPFTKTCQSHVRRQKMSVNVNSQKLQPIVMIAAIEFSVFVLLFFTISSNSPEAVYLMKEGDSGLRAAYPNDWPILNDIANEKMQSEYDKADDTFLKFLTQILALLAIVEGAEIWNPDKCDKGCRSDANCPAKNSECQFFDPNSKCGLCQCQSGYQPKGNRCVDTGGGDDAGPPPAKSNKKRYVSSDNTQVNDDTDDDRDINVNVHDDDQYDDQDDNDIDDQRCSYARIIYTCLFRRNGTECNRHNHTERTGNFRSVPFGSVEDYSLENCSYSFRSKVDFQAERSSCWQSVPFRSVEKGKYK
uniref:Uncharacterized protein n=1 Tax=Romanomermis culicivorax TaxID=13658 RepID=A0A915IYJ3_ROMCU